MHTIFSNVYVIVSTTCIIMNFIVLIVNWSFYELIVFDCELISLLVDYIDYIMTAITFKLTVLIKLWHTTFIV